MSVYVVDSNFFIQAHRVIYPLDVAISFWTQVAELANQGTIVSIDKVKNEIYQNDDELKTWCKENLPEGFFKDSTELLAEYGQTVTWAISKSGQYVPAALNEFLSADEADAWLVAYGLKNNCPIVTYEISQPEIKRKIKIPEACTALGVEFFDTIRLFRMLGIQF